MSPLHFVLMLAIAAWPLGRWATLGMAPARQRWTRIGIEVLTGLMGLAAGSHALLALGIPCRAGLVVIAVLGTLGWIRSSPPTRSTTPARTPVAIQAGAATLIILLSFSPAVESLRQSPVRHDTTFIWLPKAARALDEAPPSPVSSPEHAHAEYPRGWPSLIAAAGGFSHRLDPRAASILGVLVFILILVSLLDAASIHATPVAGIVAIAFTGAVPEMANAAPSGLADLPLAACVLLATIGLSTAIGAPMVALVAAAGAGAIKDEGLVVAAIVTLICATRAVRRRDAQSLALAFLPWAFLAPWLAIRSGVGSRATLLMPGLLDNAGLALRRIPELVGHLATMSMGPHTPHIAAAYPGLVAGSIWVLPTTFGCLLVAIVGRSKFQCRVAFGLLVASAAAYIVTPDPLEWHVWTSAERLAVQALPALALVAATSFLQTKANQGPDSATPAT